MQERSIDACTRERVELHRERREVAAAGATTSTVQDGSSYVCGTCQGAFRRSPDTNVRQLARSGAIVMSHAIVSPVCHFVAERHHHYTICTHLLIPSPGIPTV